MTLWQRIRRRVEIWLFDAPLVHPWALRGRRLLRYPYALLRDLTDGQLNLHAMGLVYTTLLAIIPLIAFSLALLRVFGASSELQPLIFEFFRPMGTRAGELTQQVLDFANRVRAGLVGSVGLALLVWTVFGTIKKVEDSVNYVWHVEVPRHFARRIAEYFALLVVGPLLVVAVIGMSQLALNGRSGQLIAGLPLLGQLRATLLQLGPYLFISGLFALVYALVPNTRVRPWPAITGGLFAGILWVIIGKLFTALVYNAARAAIIYAGLAIIVAALVWTYVGWLILLLGAQLSFYVQNPGYLRVGLRVPRLSNVESEQMCFALMYYVAQSHASRGPRWTVNSLATRAGIPAVLVARAAGALERAGLLLSTENDELLPARDAGAIELREILDVARHSDALHHGQHPLLPPVIARLSIELEEARNERCGSRTLRDLL